MVIPVRKLALVLIIFEFVLLALFFIPLTWWSAIFPSEWCPAIMERFDMDQESTIPTWFSTVLLFAVSVSTYFIYILGRENKEYSVWPSFWLAFSIVYCFLSMDEASILHEMITFGINIKWIWIYAPFAGIFFIVCAYFLLIINKNKVLANWILGGMIIYSLGALISEAVNFYLYSGRIEVAIEEGLELLGTIIVLTGCLKELNRRFMITVVG